MRWPWHVTRLGPKPIRTARTGKLSELTTEMRNSLADYETYTVKELVTITSGNLNGGVILWNAGSEYEVLTINGRLNY